MINSGPLPEHAKSDAKRKIIEQFYAQRNYEAAWVGASGIRPYASKFIEALCGATGEGLRPEYYGIEEIASAAANINPTSSSNVEDLARLDLLLTGAFLGYGSDLLNGRLDPEEVAPGWHVRTEKAEFGSKLREAIAEGSVMQTLGSLRPAHPGYDQLKEALARYLSIARDGGWPKVPPGDLLKEGMTSERVPVLRERLRATGDLKEPDGRSQAIYDQYVAGAVEQFQKRHGLQADRVVGPRTLAALNVPVEDRIRQIELNLERWRWLPRSLGERHIFVNIPEYHLYAYDSGNQVLSMAVVVGREFDDRATTVFSDTMEYVVFGPYWNVPVSIVQGEILPKAKVDPDYLKKNGFEIVSGWSQYAKVIDPAEIDWSALSTQAFPYRIRQKPGPENSLGLIKFMFPNEFSIYLHDTPAKHLFERRKRAYSHGCIRVQRPVELASYVLDSPEWRGQKIRDFMRSSEDKRVSLARKIPVYIFYLTVFAKDGMANFREDIYGADKALIEALDPSAVSPSNEPYRCDGLQDVDLSL